MTITWLETLGWAGNGCYFSRFVFQWWKAERAKASVAPRTFWWLSVGGAIALGSYSFLRGDTPLFVGYALTLSIYVRNLTIAYLGERAGRLGTVPAIILAAFASVSLVAVGALPSDRAQLATAWLVLGFVSQAVFSSRFIVQWYASERTGHAHFPRSFWWLSLVGNIGLMAYAIRLGDPVYIAGFALGPIVQARNLMLPVSSTEPGSVLLTQHQ